MFVCGHCNREYESQVKLKLHKNDKHNEMKHYRCVIPLCKFKFIRRTYLKRHLRAIHGFIKSDAKRLSKSAKSVGQTTQRVSEPYSDIEDISDDVLSDNCNTQINNTCVDVCSKDVHNTTLFSDRADNEGSDVIAIAKNGSVFDANYSTN